MNQSQTRGHLSPNEISRWLIEGPADDAAKHLEECLSCQASLAEARGPLAAFRTAVVGWSESAQVRADAGRPEAVRSWGLSSWVPALAFAMALLVVIATGVWRPHSSASHQQAVITPLSDSALMEQVDAEVSESVPDAMSPLTDLVAWDSGEQAPAAGGTGADAGKKRLETSQKVLQND